MDNKDPKKMEEYMTRHRQARRRHGTVWLLSVLTAVAVFMSLTLPAFSQTDGNPSLSAESADANSGESITVTVGASAEDGERVFLLAAKEGNAALADKYTFDSNLSCTDVADTAGNTVTLHRIYSDSGAPEYWFSLPAGQTSELRLDFTSGTAASVSLRGVSAPALADAQTMLSDDEVGSTLALTWADETAAADTTATSEDMALMRFGSNANSTTINADEQFDVTTTVKVGGEEISDSTQVYNGQSFNYDVVMKAKSGQKQFASGDVVTYTVGYVKGLNLASSWSQEKSIDGVDVGTATYSYDSSTGAITVSMIFNDNIKDYHSINMEFNAGGSFTGLTTGDSETITINGTAPVYKTITITDNPTGTEGVFDGKLNPSGTVTEADKQKCAWGLVDPSRGGGYKVGNTLYPATAWRVWYGKSITDYEAYGQQNAYSLNENLIFTDTLDKNQKFCTDGSAATGFGFGFSINNGAPFALRLPVHYYGIKYDDTDSTTGMANAFVWYPSGQESAYGSGDYGYGTTDSNGAYMYQTVDGSSFTNVNTLNNLDMNDSSAAQSIISAVSSTPMSFGIYTNSSGCQTLTINFGKLGSGSNTLTYNNTFLSYIQQRLNEQMDYARQNWDDENSRKYNTYLNTLSWYNNVKDVFGFHLDCATYVCDTSATVISNKGNFSTSSKTYEATDENTYHSSISGTLNNGDFALKKVDSAKEISGPIDSDTFNSVNGITGAEFEVDDASGNLLYFTGGAGEYTLSSSSTAGAVTTLAVNSGGCLKLAGLSYSTTYKIKETKAPDGYGLNTDQITFTVDGAKVNYFAFPDKAETGYTLPSTGGIGIAPFILAGFILTTIPLIITCWRRKKKRGGTYR